MRSGARAGSGGTGRTTLLAKLVGDDKNCKWIYRFWANPGMPRGGVLPPTPVLAPGSPTPRVRGSTRRSIQLNTLLWRPQSGASEDCHFLSLRRTQTLPGPGLEKSLNLETVATLPAGWDSAHAIRLGIKPFAELGANSEALSGSQVDSPCSLPSDPRIGPGNVAIVSHFRPFPARQASPTLGPNGSQDVPGGLTPCRFGTQQPWLAPQNSLACSSYLISQPNVTTRSVVLTSTMRHPPTKSPSGFIFMSVPFERSSVTLLATPTSTRSSPPPGPVARRAHNPLLKEAGLTKPTRPVPWLGGRSVRLACP